MAKKKENAPGKLRVQAREQLAELGYGKLTPDFQLYYPIEKESDDFKAELVGMVPPVVIYPRYLWEVTLLN